MQPSKSTVFFNLIPQLPQNPEVEKALTDVIHDEILPENAEFKELKMVFLRAKSADIVTLYFVNFYTRDIQRHRYAVQIIIDGREPTSFISPEYESELVEQISVAFRNLVLYGTQDAGLMRLRGAMAVLSMPQLILIQQWEHTQRAKVYGYKLLGFRFTENGMLEPVIDTSEDVSVMPAEVEEDFNDPIVFSDFIASLGGLDDL